MHFLRSARGDIGGPARAVVDLCGALAKRGHEVTLATVEGADLPSSWSPDSATPRIVQVKSPELGGRLYLRAASTEIGRLIASHDALHVHGMWDILNVQLCSLAARLGVPYFISVRGMLDVWSMQQSRARKLIYLSLLGGRWLRRAHRIHLTARAELDQASSWFPQERGLVIPNLLDLEPFAKLPDPAPALREYPSPPGRARLLFLSRLHPKKGVEALLRALQILKGGEQRISCLIAGSGDAGYVDSVKKLCVSLGLSLEDCRLIGSVTGPMKLALYRSADLFVLPTSQENFGFVFIESLASALPVVTTRGVDIWPELESSGGALITAADPESVAHAIASALQGPELASRGLRARDWVFSTMNPVRIIEQFESLYKITGIPDPRSVITLP